MRVGVFATGYTELRGLPGALQRLWPTHTFRAVPKRVDPAGDEVAWEGLTSGRLTTAPLGKRAERLFQGVAQALATGGGAPVADAALIVDDLELANQDQPQLVVDQVGQAARTYVDRHPRVRDLFRTRVSFHLAVPMIESWFFADPGALARAEGLTLRAPFQLCRDDPEDFETDHPGYDGDPRHPKLYVDWLTERAYRPSRHGAAILADLGWDTVLSSPTTMSFLRAMAGDLTDLLGPPALSPRLGAIAPATRLRDEPGSTLRNA